MADKSIKCLVIIALVISVLSSFLKLATLPAFIIPSCLAIFAIAFSLNFWRDGLAYFFLGFAFCVVPVFGRGAVSVYMLGWLLAKTLRFKGASNSGDSFLKSLSLRQQYALLGIALIAVSQVLGFGQSVWFFFDEYRIASILAFGKISGLYHYLTANAEPWLEALQSLTTWVIALLLCFFICRDKKVTSEQGFVLGLLTGAMFAAGYGACQVLEFHTACSFNRSAFWVYAGRYGASFSDPNSLGIMAILIVPILLWKAFSNRSLEGESSVGSSLARLSQRSIFALGAVTLFGVSLWSGSRTFWLGVALWLAYFGCKQFLPIATSKPARRIVVSSMWLLALAAIVGIFGYPSLNERLQAGASGMASVQRVLKTLNWDTAEEMFSSRLIFARIAAELFLKSPAFGIGMGAFLQSVPAAARDLGIELKGWQDNANNYYLHVLAEQGIAGIVAVVMAFCLIGLGVFGASRSENAVTDGVSIGMTGLIRPISIIVPILLLTGPHIHFEEVHFLLAALLGFGLQRGDGQFLDMTSSRMVIASSVSIYCAMLILLIAYAAKFDWTDNARFRHKGFYGAEQGERGEGDVVVWTAGKANLVFCPESNSPIRMEFRAAHPDLAKNPVAVTFIWQNTVLGTRSIIAQNSARLTDTAWQRVSLGGELGGVSSNILLTIEVDRLWSPRKYNSSGDARWLGVQVRWPESACDVR
ncbi:MAG: O-antigen ligase family protein [Deltaproteobacteria bacterium]|nr:O-antigen ligase family protein [Deltaproteobacteria bacterium]